MTRRWREKDSNPRSPRRGQHFFETSPEAEEVRFATDPLLEEADLPPMIKRKKQGNNRAGYCCGLEVPADH
jgi:hypothetical protein